MQGRHLLEVLGVLRFNDVQDVVNRDDPDQALLAIHHRHHHQVVVLEFFRDVFLVFEGVGIDHRRRHDVSHQAVFRAEDKPSQGHGARQFAAFADDIAGIDRLLAAALAADVGQGLSGRHFFRQDDVFDGHQAAGAVVGVFEDIVDFAAFGRFGLAEDGIDHVGRQFFQKIDGVVNREFIEDEGQPVLGDAVHNLPLQVAVQVGEHGGGLILGQHAEDEQPFVGVDVFEGVGDIDRVHGDHLRPQFGVAIFPQHLHEQPHRQCPPSFVNPTIIQAAGGIGLVAQPARAVRRR